MAILLIYLLTISNGQILNGGERRWDNKIHNINNIEFGITNDGSIGTPCFWPKGSGNGYIFGSGIWR